MDDLTKDDLAEFVASMIEERLRQLHIPIGRDGVVIGGSYNKTDGTVRVTYGDTAAMFPNTPDEQIDLPRVPLGAMHYGDQYGAVGGEPVVIFDAQGGPLAVFHYEGGVAPGAPAGERWICHYNALGQIDSYHKLTNDAVTPGDGKGALLSNGGALHKLTTTNGYEILQDDTGKLCHIKTPAGHLITADDNTATKGVTITTAGGLSGHFDDVAAQIKHAASATVYTLVDGAGNAVSQVAAQVGLGDLAANLDVTHAAFRKSDISTYDQNLQNAKLQDYIKYTNLLTTAGTITAAQQTTILAALVAGWTNATTVPAGSTVVKIK